LTATSSESSQHLNNSSAVQAPRAVLAVLAPRATWCTRCHVAMITTDFLHVT